MSNQTTVSDSTQVVTFTIKETESSTGNYAVPIDQVKEIRILENITKIPKSKPYVKGIMNLRGMIIPIIDVNNKIGITNSKTDSSKQRILVADTSSSLTGLLVDEVNEVMRLSSNDIEEPTSSAFANNNFVKGIAKSSDKLIVLLDVEKFLEDASDELSNALVQPRQVSNSQNVPNSELV